MKRTREARCTIKQRPRDRVSRPDGWRPPGAGAQRLGGHTVWLFDLDDTLHDATHASFGALHVAMNDYVVQYVGVSQDEASALRQHYWQRYGATLLGLVRHHDVKASHFLEETHRLPGLEGRLRSSTHDRAALRRLVGRKFVLTNAPRAYALRVLNALNLANCFQGVISIEDMRMFGHPRPKPDARMLQHVAARLKVKPSRCVLVEDTLQHQRSAHRIGMRTIWMRRYLHSVRKSVNNALEVGVHPCRKPPYVYARIHSLKTLLSL
jgi:putative hydrolase of the HAD superfamily